MAEPQDNAAPGSTSPWGPEWGPEWGPWFQLFWPPTMLAPNQSNVQTALRGFLLAILPSGVAVVQGQDNRVPEPQVSDFVVMTAIRRRRLETNTDTYADVSFMASISGTTLTVSSFVLGSFITVGNTLFGTGVATGTIITGQLSGPTGGIGTYSLSGSAQTVASEKMAAGVGNYLQPTEILFQLDVHGPNSADNAQTITTLFRDDYAVSFFETTGYDVAPIHADDPKQIPFINDQNQYETRWVVEALVQANQVVVAPQQFADTLSAETIEVDTTFPA